MKTGKITAGVAAVMIGLASPAFFMDCDEVYSEKVYDVRLSADTVNIDINDIPESREVQVGINIDNNPGFLALGFFIERDSRLGSQDYYMFNFDDNKFGITNSYHSNNTIMEIYVTHDYDTTCNDNGRIFYLNLILPENYQAGDFYPVRLVNRVSAGNFAGESIILRSNDENGYFMSDNFSEPVSGGIRITGQLPPESTPEPTPAPTPVPTPVPTAKPVTSAKPVTTVKHTQKPQDVKPSASKPGGSPAAGNSLASGSDSTEVSVSVVSETEVTSDITSVVSSEESTSVQSTASVSTVTDETCGETSCTEPVTSELVSAGDSSDKKSSGSIAAGLAGITAVAAGFLIYNFRKKGENKK